MAISEYLFGGGDIPTLGDHGFVIWTPGPNLQRFDWRSDRWVDDPEMLGIYWGSPITLNITKEQARGVIERSGGTWSEPVAPPMTPRLERIRDIRAQMQANTDSVPIPPGVEAIHDMGTVVPFWVVDPDTVLWTAGNQERVWRFDYTTDSWVLDPARPPEYIATVDTRPITEAEAEGTITSHGGTWVSP